MEVVKTAGSPSAGPGASSGSGGVSCLPGLTLSLPLQRAILHVLSCSVMGLPAVEDALCKESDFREFLARTLSQEGAGEASTAEEGAGGADDARTGAAAFEESCKLRSKAAFVLTVSLPCRRTLRRGLRTRCHGRRGEAGAGLHAVTRERGE